MERAEALFRQGAQQPPPQTRAEQPQPPEMPVHVREWLSRHPEYLDPRNAIAQGEIHVATLKCLRDGLTWNDDNFLPTIERHLGLTLTPTTNGHENRHVGTPTPTSPAPPRREPERLVRAMRGVPVSAPPHREIPSMSSGRPVGRLPPLTQAELEIAAACGQTPEQYQQQKARMMQLKQAGVIQDGG